MLEHEWFDAEKAEPPEELITVLVYTAGGRVTFGAWYEGRWEVEWPTWDGPYFDGNPGSF